MITNKRTDPMSISMANNAVLIDQGKAHLIDFKTNVSARPSVMVPKPNIPIDWNNVEGSKSVERAAKILVDVYKEIIKDREAKENLLLHQVVVLKNNGINGRHVVNRACEKALIKLGVLKKGIDSVRLRTDTDGSGLFLFPGKKITFTKKYKAIMGKNGMIESDSVLNGEQGIVIRTWVTTYKRKRYIWMKFSEFKGSKAKTVKIHRVEGINPYHIDNGYAITTNKAQGSGWPYIIYWIEDNPSKHWTRPYSYVAISRCITSCWVIGDRNDFLEMCKQPAQKRYTILSTMLKEWQFDADLLIDQLSEVDSMRDFNLLELMDSDIPCSPTPMNPKKKKI